jgi:hypothetical protein
VRQSGQTRSVVENLEREAVGLGIKYKVW